MDNPWSKEYSRLALVIFAMVVVSLITGYWIITSYVFLIGYILWQYYNLGRLEHWLVHGLENKHAPSSSGVWQTIVQLIYRQKRASVATEKRLSTTIQRHQSMTSTLPYAVVILNQSLEIEWSNSAAEKHLGIRNQDQGQNISNFIRNRKFRKYLNKTGERRSLKMPSPVQSAKTLSLTFIAVGKQQHLLTAWDISQRVELQRTRKLFVANASHELKTPLCVIAGYLEILSSEESLPDDIRQAIASAMQQADRMRSIIDDLLLLSILENKPQDSDDWEAIDVDSKLRNFIKGLEQSGESKDHEILLESDENLQITAIEVEFSSVYMNFINNAIKHTAAGSTIHVSWKISDDRKFACLIVEDNGAGIAPKDLAHISERFYRANNGKNTSGTGLGLSIVKHVLERYGGRLDVTSQIGQGTCFTAYFPESLIYQAE